MGLVPDGLYRVSIASIEETASQNGKLMYNTQFEIMEPADFAGMMLFELFCIGTDEDPDAVEEKAWRGFAATRMKAMLKSAQVPMDDDMDNIIAAAIQQQLIVAANQEVDDGTRDPKYKGRVRNRISSFYQLGHKEVGLTDAPAAAKKPLAAVPKAAAPAAAPAAPTRTIMKAPLPATGGATLSKPAGPVTRPTAPKPTAKAAEVKCTICDTMVARVEFAAHVEAHADES